MTEEAKTETKSASAKDRMLGLLATAMSGTLGPVAETIASEASANGCKLIEKLVFKGTTDDKIAEYAIGWLEIQLEAAKLSLALAKAQQSAGEVSS